MKKQLILLTTAIPLIFGINDVKGNRKFELKRVIENNNIYITRDHLVISNDVVDINILINALIEVESLGNDSAIGDLHLVGNEAVGALQIRPIMIREVNRILKIRKSTRRFKHSDRFSREKSIEMFMVWKKYHHLDSSFEKIARNWNGGPRGYKKKGTENYWTKVKIELNN